MVAAEVSSSTFISTDTIVPIAVIVGYSKSPTYLPQTLHMDASPLSKKI